MAVRTTPLSISSVLKKSSKVPSQTEPPRGTMASPNTVMTMEPVRDGSLLRWPTMRASGCGIAPDIAAFADSNQRGQWIIIDQLDGQCEGAAAPHRKFHWRCKRFEVAWRARGQTITT